MQYKINHSRLFLYYYKVRKRQKAFESLLFKLSKETNVKKQLALANEAASFATYYPTGYLSSSILENVYISIARSIPPVHSDYTPNRILHVLTKVYLTGGHTRVVDRWITLSPSNITNDIIIINQENEPIPSWLQETVYSHNGQIILINEPDQIVRASQLRNIACGYEKIVLHTHMDDGTALMAFGTESFTRPVLLFNHADHCFWLGVSIADLVADIQNNNINTRRRNVRNFQYLGIPPQRVNLAIENTDKRKRTILKRLGIPQNAFILITTGAPGKMRPVHGLNLISPLLKIIKKHSNCYYIVIGPQINEKIWSDAYTLSNGRIIAVGEVPNTEEYTDLLLSSDIFIGAFPIMSYTATMDAIQCGLPFLQLQASKQSYVNSIFNDKYIEKDMICYSSKELVHKIEYAISDKTYYHHLLLYSKKWLSHYSNEDNWKENLSSIYSSCPNHHSIHQFSNIHGNDVLITDKEVLNSFYYSRNFSYKSKFMLYLCQRIIR